MGVHVLVLTWLAEACFILAQVTHAFPRAKHHKGLHACQPCTYVAWIQFNVFHVQ